MGPDNPLFPIGKYAQDEWTTFLETKMNLRKTVNPDLYMMCAKSVVKESEDFAKRNPALFNKETRDVIPVNKEIFDKAYLLVEYFRYFE